MSLPTPWVDRIFDKLTLVYGQAFLRRWADIDMNAVKSDWGHELAGFQQQPRAIAYALENLPAERPPTVLEFRAMARRCPAEDVPRLESPKADPERVAAELAKLAPILAKPVARGVVDAAWAHRILAAHAAGVRKTPTVLRMAREVAERNPK